MAGFSGWYGSGHPGVEGFFGLTGPWSFRHLVAKSLIWMSPVSLWSIYLPKSRRMPTRQEALGPVAVYAVLLPVIILAWGDADILVPYAFAGVFTLLPLLTTLEMRWGLPLSGLSRFKELPPPPRRPATPALIRLLLLFPAIQAAMFTSYFPMARLLDRLDHGALPLSLSLSDFKGAEFLFLGWILVFLPGRIARMFILRRPVLLTVLFSALTLGVLLWLAYVYLGDIFLNPLAITAVLAYCFAAPIVYWAALTASEPPGDNGLKI